MSSTEKGSALVHAYIKFLHPFSTGLFGFRNSTDQHFDNIFPHLRKSTFHG